MHSSGSLADTPDCFLVRTADQEKKDSNMIQHDAILPALIPCHLKENKTKISILPTKKGVICMRASPSHNCAGGSCVSEDVVICTHLLCEHLKTTGIHDLH